LFDTRAITATEVVRLERLVADQAAVGLAGMYKDVLAEAGNCFQRGSPAYT